MRRQGRCAALGRRLAQLAVLVLVCTLPASAMASGTLDPIALPQSNGTAWNAVNDANQVAGNYDPPGTTTQAQLAQRWQDGSVTTFPVPGASVFDSMYNDNGSAYAVDAAGGLYGGEESADASDDSRGYPVIWTPSGEGSLPPAGTGSYNGYADWLSASANGNVAGTWCGNNGFDYTPCQYVAGDAPTGGGSYAFATVPVSLGANEENAPISINSAGEIAVGGHSDGLPSVLLLTGVNGSQETPSIVLAGTDHELNNNGDVIGLSGGEPAIELANGTVKVLPLLNAGDTATPSAINDSDEVVGEECTPAPQTCTGVAWIGGQVMSIASMINGAVPTFIYPVDVNSGGSILSQDGHNGSSGDYLLEPMPHFNASIVLTGANGQPFSGGSSAVGQTLTATVTLSNTSATDSITGITVDPPLLVSPAATLTLLSGPTPAPPTALASGASASYALTYTVNTPGIAKLSVSASGTEGDAPATADAQTIAHLGQPIQVSVTFLQNGTPIPNNTIKLADTDDGEVPQDLTAQVTLKNISQIQQDNVTFNGGLTASFHSAQTALPTVPVTTTASPSPPPVIASIAPGATAKQLFNVHVTNNGVFDLSAQVTSGDDGASTTEVSSGLGTLTANPTALLYVDLTPSMDGTGDDGLLTAGNSVIVTGEVTNRSNTQTLDLTPIEPKLVGFGNAGGGALTDSSVPDLPDGVRLPLSGELEPGETVEVEATIDTAPVPGTRATLTYSPQASIENPDGSETPLTSDQIRLGAGSSPIDLSFSSGEAAIPTPSLESVAGAFAQGAFDGAGQWLLGHLSAAGEVLQHPFDSAVKLASGTGKVIVATGVAFKEAAGLVATISLVGLGAEDMTEKEKQDFVNQIVSDYQQTSLHTGIEAIRAAADPILQDFENAYYKGDYNTVARMSGQGLATGAGAAADAVLTDIAFQKLALLVKAKGVSAANTVMGKAIRLSDALAQANLVPKAGKALAGIAQGQNLLADGARALIDSYGLTRSQVTKLRDLCEAAGITVAIRSRSARAAELIKQGIAIGKNIAIKLKNVDDIDVQFLDYSRADLNTVVWAKPISRAEFDANLAKFPKMTDALREIAEARYAARLKEWANRYYHIKLDTWETTGQIKLYFDGAGSGVGELDKTRVVYRRFELQQVKTMDRYYRRLLVGDGPGKTARLFRVTQDVDTVAVLGGDSSILARELAAKVYVYLEDTLGIQHPDTVPWVLDGDVLSNAKLDLLKDHLVGGEQLAVFGADGSVLAGYWNPFLTVFDPVTKGGYIFFQGAYNNPYAKLIASAILRLQGP
jgi:hypothetical protein